MKMIALFLSGIVSLAMFGCHFFKGTEPEKVDFIIVWMLSRSPTNPILYYRNEEARSMGVKYAKSSLDFYNIRGYQLRADQLKRLKRIAYDAPDRDTRKDPPYLYAQQTTNL